MSISRSLLSSAIVTIAIFVTTLYTACKKTPATSSDNKCATVVCKNGGSCFKGACSCPFGFEGTYCEKAWLSRYVGKWRVTETITASTNNAMVGDTSSYTCTIKGKDGSPALFLIDDFHGNSAVDNVTCRMGADSKGGNALPNYFIFNYNQALGSTYILMTSGHGILNSTNNMSGVFDITYPGSSGSQPDTNTVSFTAEYIN